MMKTNGSKMVNLARDLSPAVGNQQNAVNYMAAEKEELGGVVQLLKEETKQQ